jgi:hypothetical protein
VVSSISSLTVISEGSPVCISSVTILSRLQFSLCPHPPTSDPVKRRLIFYC